MSDVTEERPRIRSVSESAQADESMTMIGGIQRQQTVLLARTEALHCGEHAAAASARMHETLLQLKLVGQPGANVCRSDAATAHAS